MYKLLKKIKKKFYNNLDKQENYDVVENILVLFSSHINHSLNKAFNLLKEDFKITLYDCLDKNKLDVNYLNRFDFVMVISTSNGHTHNLFKSTKNIKSLCGILILDEVILKNETRLKCYDLLWFQTYEIYNSLPKNISKIHAYGIDITQSSLLYEGSSIKTKEDVLYARLNQFNLDNNTFIKFPYFIKCPIWDINYLANQLRFGYNFYQKELKRSTNLIKSNKNLMVGRYSFYNKDFLITGDEYVSIGSFCSIGKNVSIYTSNHDTNYAATQGFIYRKYFNKNHPGERLLDPSKSRTKGPVIIQNDVWIGDGVKIMSGVKIGNGACIAAGSIVTSNVGDYEIVGGVPAKIIKMRFDSPKLINQLLELEWWNWSDKKIGENEVFFNLAFSKLENIERHVIK